MLWVYELDVSGIYDTPVSFLDFFLKWEFATLSKSYIFDGRMGDR
jgi:hypothetical protein